MFKNIVIFIIISALAVISVPYYHAAIQDLLALHHIILNMLGHVFPAGMLYTFFKELIALIAIPLITIIIIGGIFRIFARRKFPYLEEIMWVIWIILAVGIAYTA